MPLELQWEQHRVSGLAVAGALQVGLLLKIFNQHFN